MPPLNVLIHLFNFVPAACEESLNSERKCSFNVRTETKPMKFDHKQGRALTLAAAHPILAKYLSIQIFKYSSTRVLHLRREGIQYCIFAP